MTVWSSLALCADRIETWEAAERHGKLGSVPQDFSSRKDGQNSWGEHKGVLAHEALQSSYRVGRVRTKALGFVEPCCLRGGFVTIIVFYFHWVRVATVSGNAGLHIPKKSRFGLGYSDQKQQTHNMHKKQGMVLSNYPKVKICPHGVLDIVSPYESHMDPIRSWML